MAKMILLDTSVLIEILDHGKNKELLENDCFISIVSIYEYIRYKRKAKEAMELLESAFKIITLESNVVLFASEIFSKLKESRTLVNENDIYIAASALAYNLKLYTKDKDFKKIGGFFKNLDIEVL